MPEFLLDHDPDMSQWVRPDEDGFTVRTRFHGEQQILDQLQRERSVDPKPRVVTEEGVTYRKAGSIPISLIHKFFVKHQRMPTAAECLDWLRDRDYSKLRATEEKF